MAVAGGVVVKAGPIFFKDTVQGVDPGVPIAEDGGFPVGKAAVLHPGTVGGRKTNAGAVPWKVDAGKIADPVRLVRLGTNLDPSRKRSARSMFL